MEWKKEENGSREYLILSSGRRLATTNHVVGINPEDLSIYSGNGMYLETDILQEEFMNMEEVEQLPLTESERAELANYMISVWKQFKPAGKLGEKDLRIGMVVNLFDGTGGEIIAIQGKKYNEWNDGIGQPASFNYIDTVTGVIRWAEINEIKSIEYGKN